MLAGGSMVAALGLMTDLPQFLPPSAPIAERCQTVVEPKAVLSRDKLAQLLAVAEGAPRSQVQQVVQSPYCRLPDVQVRAGATTQREAYPLAFDPQTWFVVSYEGESYAGYSFSFRR